MHTAMGGSPRTELTSGTNMARGPVKPEGANDIIMSDVPGCTELRCAHPLCREPIPSTGDPFCSSRCALCYVSGLGCEQFDSDCGRDRPEGHHTVPAYHPTAGALAIITFLVAFITKLLPSPHVILPTTAGAGDQVDDPPAVDDAVDDPVLKLHALKAACTAIGPTCDATQFAWKLLAAADQVVLNRVRDGDKSLPLTRAGSGVNANRQLKEPSPWAGTPFSNM